MLEEQIDLCLIDETHFRNGNNIDLSIFDEWSPRYLERGFGDKGGGGKMILTSKRLVCRSWAPDLKDNEWVGNERAWTLVHNGGCKLAICSIYMAAEVVANNDFRAWNDCVYGILAGEVQCLKNDGYDVMVIGDLNGHIGSGPEGIEGNRPGINSNGQRILDFVDLSQMYIVNRDSNVCNGTFTRITETSSSILDYVLVCPDLRPKILRMGIDHDIELLANSDHVAIRVDVRMECNMEGKRAMGRANLFLKEGRDTSKAKHRMDALLEDVVDYKDMDVHEKCKVLQSIIVEANVTEYGKSNNTKKIRAPALKRLRHARRECEAKVRKLSLERVRKIIANEPWTQDNQQDLDHFARENDQISEAIQKRSLELRLASRTDLRMRQDMTTKQYWRLYKKNKKKEGLITALQGPDGNIETDVDKVVDIALTDVASVFNGCRAKYFKSHGEQILKEVTVGGQFNYERWCPKVREELAYEEEVCAPVSVKEVREVIDSHKTERAPGVDNVLTSMLKTASDLYVGMLTDLVNECFDKGIIPESLQAGKMTLIDKKEKSLEVKKKRPLTVSSVILSVMTKILQRRMDPICEREGFYGSVQYGFRKRRSTADCVFIILAAVRAARRKHHSISLAFCDISKAYDSVCRELLYLKLKNVGFGGKVVGLIRAMYFNDCVRLNMASGLTDPVYFTQGVKQGCSLSPMLFALYVSGLGDALHRSQLGIELGEEIITALFFADDLVLISRTPKLGMDKLIKAVMDFGEDMRMSLSPTKTYILSNASYDVSWSLGEDTIEEILVAKYLGVKIQIRGRTIIGQYENDMIRRAKSYAYSLMNLTRGGLDRAHIAHKLWESCAIPAILYCAEAVTIRRSTIETLEQIQNHVGRFILQVPTATSRSLAWMDAGLMPMECRILVKQAKYIWNILHSKNNPTLMLILHELLDNETDPWTRSWLSLQAEIGIIGDFASFKALDRSLKAYAVRRVMEVKESHTSMMSTPIPVQWFKVQGHVNDSIASKWLCLVRGGNAQLGNRYRNKYDKTYLTCPRCSSVGNEVKLNEAHVVLACTAVYGLRRDLGIYEYLVSANNNGYLSNQEVLRLYVGGDLATPGALMNRGRALNSIIQAWLTSIHENGG